MNDNKQDSELQVMREERETQVVESRGAPFPDHECYVNVTDFRQTLLYQDWSFSLRAATTATHDQFTYDSAFLAESNGLACFAAGDRLGWSSGPQLRWRCCSQWTRDRDRAEICASSTAFLGSS